MTPDCRLEREQLKSALACACLAGGLTCARAGANPPLKSEMMLQKN